VSHIKLREGEAKQLAALLRKIGRPIDPKDSADMWRWVKRLEGVADDEA
jgi:hypothetical protein